MPHVTIRSGAALQEAKVTIKAGGESVTELALAQQLEGAMPVDLRSEEDTWVERARLGDVEAFDEIMARYEQRLLRFLIGQVGDVEIAKELCQDTFLSAYRALPKVKGELKLSAWLHTIALNNARSHHRRRRFRFFVSIDDHDVPSHGPDMQERIADHDLVTRVLRELPRQYSEPLLLQLGGGMSCREIADVMKCSEGAIKVRLMRARGAFKRAYQSEVGG